MKPGCYRVMALFAPEGRPIAGPVASPHLANLSCLPTLAVMKMARLAIPLLLSPALLLAACGVEQSQPAPVTDADRWGHLPPDPERVQQAEQTSAPLG